MTKHKVQKFAAFLLTAFLLLLVAIPANAAPTKKYPNGMLTPPPPSYTLQNVYVPGSGPSNPGEISINAMKPGQIYLGQGAVGLGILYGQFTFSAQTECNYDIEINNVKVSLYQWNGSRWILYYDSNTNTTYNRPTSVIFVSNLNPPKGYYYQAVGYHSIYHKGVTEDGHSYSSIFSHN